MNHDEQMREIREARARRYHEQQPPAAPTAQGAQGGEQPPAPPANQAPPPAPPTVQQQAAVAMPAAPAQSGDEPSAPEAERAPQQGGRLIGLPGQNANLTAAELEQRARAAQKNRELDDHNRGYDQPAPARADAPAEPGVRAPAAGDRNRVMRMADVEPFEVDAGPMPDLSDMLQGAPADELRALGLDMDREFDGMDESIEREIDAQLAADTTAPDAAGNMLQVYDAQGRDMVGQVDEAEAEALDPQAGGGVATAPTADIEDYSVASTLQDVSKLPSDGRTCAVCQEELAVGDRVRRLNCLHIFHADCVDAWLRRTAQCPVCKHEFDAGQQLMDSVVTKEQP